MSLEMRQTEQSASSNSSPSLSETARAAVAPQEQSLTDCLAASRVGRYATLLAAMFIGGGSSFLTGCGPQKKEEPRAAFASGLGASHGGAVGIPLKEAKYSTLGDNVKIPLSEVEAHTALRTGARDAISPAHQAVVELIAAVEGKKFDRATLESLQCSISAAEQSLTNAADDKMMAKGRDKVLTAIGTLTILSKTSEEDFKTGTDSVGYARAVNAQVAMSDLKDALDRDLHLMKQAQFAAEIVKLDKSLEHFSTALTPLEKADLAWFEANGGEVTTLRTSMAEAVKTVEGAEKNVSFAAIKDDLTDVKQRLNEITVVTKDATEIKEYFTPKEGVELTAGRALVKETLVLVKALREDLDKELTNTLQVERAPQSGDPKTAPQAPVSPTPGQATGGAASSVVHHHHSSSNGFNGFLLGYLIGMNRGPSYVYPPHSSPGYSGSDRFRSSSSYSAFGQASHATSSAASGSKGIGARPSGGAARPAPSAGGGGVGGGAHVGGAHGGGGAGPAGGKGGAHGGGFGGSGHGAGVGA